jgi:hypothetical protein
MKKILLALSLLAVTGTAMAQQYHGNGFRHPGYYRGPGIGWWVAPVVTGVIGYEIAKQQQVIVQQPVVVQNPPLAQGQICTPWTETQNSDGTITRTRTCNQ